ncbi:X8 domain [Sesbania bispinosa]|nr:X8 domain [Sesbania bispinosa]
MATLPYQCAVKFSLLPLALAIVIILILTEASEPVSAVGINYGTLGNNLPSPKKVAQLLQSSLINKVKIYDSNPQILQAFSNTGIDLIVAVENSLIANLSSDPSSAQQWLSTRVLPFLPATSIVAIAVGNEYLTTNIDDNQDRLNPNSLFQAMQNLHSVLSSHGLDRKIKVGSRGPSVWCVAKPHAEDKVLQSVLDFCCGPGGVDCREVYEGGDCYQPNKLLAHASYAMNAYYQMHGRNYWNCDFKATGLVTFSDPSYGTCRYPQQ